MTAPAEVIHLQDRRIGDLDDKQLVGTDVVDGAGRNAAGERVEAVEYQPQRGVIDIAHQRPGFAVVIDMTPPGQRFVTDAQAPARGAFPGFSEIRQHPPPVGIGLRGTAGADQQQVRAEFLHRVELALQPVESAAALGVRQAFQIAERLEHRAGKAQVGHQRGHLAGGKMGGKQVVLEDLRAVVARRGDRPQLRVQRAADRYRGDRGLHVPQLPVRFHA